MEKSFVDQLNEHFRTVIVPKYPRLFKEKLDKIGIHCEERHTFSRIISFCPTEKEEKVTLANFWNLFYMYFWKKEDYIYLELTFKDFDANKQVSDFPTPAKYYMKSMVIRKKVGVDEYKQIVEASSDYHERIDNLFPGTYGYSYITDKCYQHFLNCGMLAYIEFMFNEIEKDIPRDNDRYRFDPIKGEIVLNERHFVEAEERVIESNRIRAEQDRIEQRERILSLYLKPDKKYPQHDE